MLSAVLKTVFLLPRRMVPPMSPPWCSGMSTMTGWVVSGFISVLWASAQCSTFLRNREISEPQQSQHVPGELYDSSLQTEARQTPR